VKRLDKRCASGRSAAASVGRQLTASTEAGREREQPRPAVWTFETTRLRTLQYATSAATLVSGEMGVDQRAIARASATREAVDKSRVKPYP